MYIFPNEALAGQSLRSQPYNKNKKTGKHMRNLRIDVRVSEEEKIELVRLAAGQEMSLSDYLRSVLLGKEIIVRRENHAPAALIYELSRIGNNLNQLARHANSGSSITPDDLARIWHSLELLWAASQ